MSDASEKEILSLGSFPASAAATTVATTLGYQVLSLVGSRVRDALSSTFTNAAESNQVCDKTSPLHNNAGTDRRTGRRLLNGNGTEIIIDEDLPVYTLKEISFHDTPDDCWMTIYDRVYDVTDFISRHPGGDEVMLEYAGRDATIAFRGVGHSSLAEESLKQYLVGILPESQRIWTRSSNMNADKPT